MRVLITGISGFVGEYLTYALNKDNPSTQIFGLERQVKPFQLFPELNTKVKVFSCDITDKKNVLKIIQEIKPDQVYHLAGFASAAGQDKKLIYNINVQGTINILEALKKTRKKTRIILASTAYVYGVTSWPAKENSKINPRGFYAQSKAEMEREAKRFFSDLEIIISRAANHTGPGQKLGFVMPDFASQIVKIQNQGEILVGNLEAKRDFLDVKDVVRAYQMLMKKGKAGEVYNISLGRPISIKKILQKLIKISGRKIKIVTDPDKVRPLDMKINSLDPSKLWKIGWKPKISLDTTLKNVLKYWRSKLNS